MAALLKGERYNVGQLKTTVTYYYNCYLRDGTLCQGSATLKPASSARLAASDPSCSPAVKTNSCSNQISLAVAAGQFYEQLLCQSTELFKDDNGQYAREKIMAYLTNHQQASQSRLPTLAFPSDLSPVVDALMNQQCVQAGQLIGAANGQSTIPIADYNQLASSQYNPLKQDMVNSVLQSIDFQKTVGGNVLDDNDKNSCQYYPTYKTDNPIKEKAKWYYIPEQQTDALKAKVRPKDRAKDVELTAMGNVEVSSLVNAQSPITFNLKGGVMGLGQVLGKEKGKPETIDGLNVIVCKKTSIRISIYVVKNKKGGSFKVDQPAIESYVKSFFRTINFDVSIKFVAKEIDYAEFDKDGNGQIDKIDNDATKDEANKMVSYPIDDNPDGFKVIMVSLPVKKPGMSADQYVGGYADVNFRAVDKDTKLTLKTSDYKAIDQSIVIGTANGKVPFLPGTITHELGHFVLGLKHPFTQFSPNFAQADDALNIMDYEFKTDSSTVIVSTADRLFRAYQVKSIQDNLK